MGTRTVLLSYNGVVFRKNANEMLNFLEGLERYNYNQAVLDENNQFVYTGDWVVMGAISQPTLSMHFWNVSISILITEI